MYRHARARQSKGCFGPNLEAGAIPLAFILCMEGKRDSVFPPKYEQVHGLDSWRKSRVYSRMEKVFPNETTALALRVLRATARCSMCDWAYIRPFTDYAPVRTSIVGKAVEGNLGRLRD